MKPACQGVGTIAISAAAVLMFQKDPSEFIPFFWLVGILFIWN